MKNFEHNGKKISKNIVKLNLKQNINLCCIMILSTMCRGNRFLINLLDKTENSL